MGRRRGPECDRNGGVRHRRLGRGRAGRDRRRAHQLHPARRRQPLQRHHRRQLRDRGLGPATTSPAATCRQRGLAVPGTIKANGDFNPGFGGPIKRDKLWFFLSGRSLFADNYVASTFFNQNANKLDRFDYVPSTDQAILHQEQTIYQARLTWQATPKHKFGVTFDQENFCACTTGIGPGPAVP